MSLDRARERRGGGGGGPKINEWVPILLKNNYFFRVELILRGSIFNVTDPTDSLEAELDALLLQCSNIYEQDFKIEEPPVNDGIFTSVIIMGFITPAQTNQVSAFVTS